MSVTVACSEARFRARFFATGDHIARTQPNRMPLSISVPVADKIEIMEFRTRQNDDLSSLFFFIVISFVLRQIGSLGILPRANSPRNNKRPPRHVIPGGVEPPPVEPIRLNPRFHTYLVASFSHNLSVIM